MKLYFGFKIGLSVIYTSIGFMRYKCATLSPEAFEEFSITSSKNFETKDSNILKDSKILNKYGSEKIKKALDIYQTEIDLKNKDLNIKAIILDANNPKGFSALQTFNKNYINIDIQEVIENDFHINKGALYHEIGHIKYNDGYRKNILKIVFNSTIAPIIIMTHLKLFPILICGTYIIDKLYCRRLEKRADLFSASNGYADSMIKEFENDIKENLEKKLIHITSKGNNLKDFEHPFLTTRIEYLKEYKNLGKKY